MTKPDEALLWAREHWATTCDKDGFTDEAEAYRRGVCDETLATDALFYRAGAAASEARIKALEYEVRELKAQNFRMLSLEDQAQARDRGEA
jgi:hypothetical protein